MTDQRPVGSGFNAATTADEVIAGQDLKGKTAIVTGGCSGLGLAAARTLASGGAEVIIAARDKARAQVALALYPELALKELDLMDPQSIDAFAARFLDSGRSLHILVNSAEIMAAPLARDARGYESHFSTNHLGHFQLTARLWPALRKAGSARVVAVSSRGHARGPADFEDPNFERHEYDPWEAYSQSKTANVLFAVELDARAKADGVRAFSLHPGAIVTNLGRFLPPGQMRNFGLVDDHGKPVIDPANDKKSPEQGAATIVWCATSPRLEGKGGVYCEDCDIAVAVSANSPLRTGVRPWAIDPKLAARLWTMSEKLTGVGLS